MNSKSIKMTSTILDQRVETRNDRTKEKWEL